MAMISEFDAYSWIVTNVAYGSDLKKPSYQTVASLALLCAYFEEEYGNNGAGKAVLRTCADNARLRGDLTAPLKSALAFWKARYVENNHLNASFRIMNWRPNDDRRIVEAVLLEKAASPNDQLMALLTISYRLRNNLFHGLKGIGELNEQRQNLAVACRVLSTTMELL